MNLGIVAQSGWGKSHTTQEKIEKNLPNVDLGIIFDHDDEYRGLVKAGFANWSIAGPKEIAHSVDYWVNFILSNKKVVMARYMLSDNEWRHIIGMIGKAFRRIYEQSTKLLKVMIVIDEAHTVAPQDSSYPDSITDIATAGRGEGVSTIWITQRIAKLCKDIVSQFNAIYAGGFTNKNDLDALPIEYPQIVHNPLYLDEIKSLPSELHSNEGPFSLRKLTDNEERVIGQEFIFSDETGKRWRELRKGNNMKSTHYGSQGWRLDV